MSSTVDVPTSQAPPPVDAEGSALPDSDDLYEVVNGQHVEGPPTGTAENVIALQLEVELEQWNREHVLGWVTREDLFSLAEGLKCRPDVAFVAFDRWPHAEVPDAEAWETAPTLAVEVISRSNTACDGQARIGDYFQAGTNLVWIIYPRQRKVYCFQSPLDVRVVDEQGTIDGGNILPGFFVPVKRLFDSLKQPAGK